MVRLPSALKGTEFISFRLCDLNYEDSRDLQDRRLMRTGHTSIEDNTANQKNRMDRGMCVFVKRGIAIL